MLNDEEEDDKTNNEDYDEEDIPEIMVVEEGEVENVDVDGEIPEVEFIDEEENATNPPEETTTKIPISVLDPSRFDIANDKITSSTEQDPKSTRSAYNVMWYCNVLVLQCLSFAILSSLPFFFSLKYYSAALEYCCSGNVKQCYGYAELWCYIAMVLQCYGASVLLMCIAIVPQCFWAAVLWN